MRPLPRRIVSYGVIDKAEWEASTPEVGPLTVGRRAVQTAVAPRAVVVEAVSSPSACATSVGSRSGAVAPRAVSRSVSVVGAPSGGRAARGVTGVSRRREMESARLRAAWSRRAVCFRSPVV